MKVLYSNIFLYCILFHIPIWLDIEYILTVYDNIWDETFFNGYSRNLHWLEGRTKLEISRFMYTFKSNVKSFALSVHAIECMFTFFCESKNCIIWISFGRWWARRLNISWHYLDYHVFSFCIRICRSRA